MRGASLPPEALYVAVEGTHTHCGLLRLGLAQALWVRTVSKALGEACRRGWMHPLYAQFNTAAGRSSTSLECVWHAEHGPVSFARPGCS